MRADIAPGQTFPDYELTDHTKTRRKLSELQGNDPMILVLSARALLPEDHQQHLELAAFYPKIAVALHPGRHHRDGQHPRAQRVPLVRRRPVDLSQTRAQVQKDLDIQEYTDPTRPDDPSHAGAQAGESSSTASTTATGSGAGRRPRTSGAILVR